MREKVPDAGARLELLSPLGFGHANVVVAAPRAWIDVRSMADLDDVASAYRAKRGERMRVATKYVNLTRRFFAEHGVADYRIVESLGATEGAPASGAAELIVDITTTGATLAANALKPLDDGVILRSQANLVASLTAPWGAKARQAARGILARIAASEEASKSREVRARLPSPAHLVVETAPERFGAVPRPARTSIRTASSRSTAPAARSPSSPAGSWRRAPSGSASPRSNRPSTPATPSTKRWSGGSGGAVRRRTAFPLREKVAR